MMFVIREYGVNWATDSPLSSLSQLSEKKICQKDKCET